MGNQFKKLNILLLSCSIVNAFIIIINNNNNNNNVCFLVVFHCVTIVIFGLVIISLGHRINGLLELEHLAIVSSEHTSLQSWYTTKRINNN